MGRGVKINPNKFVNSRQKQHYATIIVGTVRYIYLKTWIK